MPADDSDTSYRACLAPPDGISARYTAYLEKYGASPELIRRARNARVDGDTGHLRREAVTCMPLGSIPWDTADELTEHPPPPANRPNQGPHRVAPQHAWWERLAALAGADPDLLRDLPASRARYTMLGVALLVSALFTGASMAFAVVQVTKADLVVGVLIGAVLGSLVLAVERFAVVSMVARGRTPIGHIRRILALIPQVVLIFLLSALVGPPMTLSLFAPEIDKQLTVMQADQIAEAKRQASASTNQEFARLDDARRRLDQVRDQLAAEYAKPEKDQVPQIIASLSQELAAAEPAVRQAEVNLAQRARVVVDQEEAIRDSQNGLLARLTALDRLTQVNPELRIASYTLILLFVLIPLLPLMLALLAGPQSTGAYDLMARVQEQYHARQRELALLRQTGRQELDNETALTELEERIAAVKESMNREHDDLVGKVIDLDARRRRALRAPVARP